MEADLRKPNDHICSLSGHSLESRIKVSKFAARIRGRKPDRSRMVKRRMIEERKRLRRGTPPARNAAGLSEGASGHALRCRCTIWRVATPAVTTRIKMPAGKVPGSGAGTWTTFGIGANPVVESPLTAETPGSATTAAVVVDESAPGLAPTSRAACAEIAANNPAASNTIILLPNEVLIILQRPSRTVFQFRSQTFRQSNSTRFTGQVRQFFGHDSPLPGHWPRRFRRAGGARFDCKTRRFMR